MKNSITGFALAWQFFSAVPVKKQLDMNERSITWMFGWLPIIGLMMGGAVALATHLLVTYTALSSLFLAIVIVVAMIVLTGGLHLDGWLDMSDAYFSYGDKEKRLEILDDPRTGAFGVISFVCLILLKVAAIHEVILHAHEALPYLVIIPMIARLAMQIYFLTTATSKQKGLAAYFKKNVEPVRLWWIVLCYIVGIATFAIICQFYSVIILLGAVLFVIWVYYHWSKRNFGGMSGDLLGALCEGSEVVLWLIVLSFI